MITILRIFILDCLVVRVTKILVVVERLPIIKAKNLFMRVCYQTYLLPFATIIMDHPSKPTSTGLSLPLSLIMGLIVSYFLVNPDYLAGSMPFISSLDFTSFDLSS